MLSVENGFTPLSASPFTLRTRPLSSSGAGRCGVLPLCMSIHPIEGRSNPGLDARAKRLRPQEFVWLQGQDDPLGHAVVWGDVHNGPMAHKRVVPIGRYVASQG